MVGTFHCRVGASAIPAGVSNNLVWTLNSWTLYGIPKALTMPAHAEQGLHKDIRMPTGMLDSVVLEEAFCF